MQPQIWARMALALSVSVALPTAVRATTYTITDLGAVSGLPDSFATSISNTGYIALSSNDLGVGTAIYSSGHTTAISSLAGNSDTLAAVHNAGVAVGFSTDLSGNSQAVYASASNPSPTVLPTLSPGGQGAANGINSAGSLSQSTIVGWSLENIGQGNSIQTAVTWTGAGTTSVAVNTVIPQNSTVLDARQSSMAYAVNATDVIVGQAYNYLPIQADEQQDAFLVNGPTVKDIAPVGSTQSAALAVNAGGYAVGYSLDAASNQSGFVYSPATGQSTLLQTFGGGGGVAASINDLNQIVGSSNLSDGSGPVAVIYDSHGNPIDLNTLIPVNSGWMLVFANSINNSGDIVGSGLLNGNQDAFLLTPSSPVPEPTVLLGAGAGLALLRRRTCRVIG